MIVISDTSCIGYLIIIDKLYLLKENFSSILIPQKVHEKTLQLSKKYNLSKYLNSEWITITAISNIEFYKELLKNVDEGESEAIVLAKELNADLLLIDERKDTVVARSFGIKNNRIIGCLIIIKREKFNSLS